VHLVSLPPYSPELNPTEAIGDVVKDRIGNVLWNTIADLEQSIGEELRPLCENPECVRRLVSHPWLVEQANVTATENSAITCSKRYHSLSGGDPFSHPSGSSASRPAWVTDRTVAGGLPSARNARPPPGTPGARKHSVPNRVHSVGNDLWLALPLGGASNLSQTQGLVESP
jgi:hypothetical protein